MSPNAPMSDAARSFISEVRATYGNAADDTRLFTGIGNVLRLASAAYLRGYEDAVRFVEAEEAQRAAANAEAGRGE